MQADKINSELALEEQKKVSLTKPNNPIEGEDHYHPHKELSRISHSFIPSSMGKGQQTLEPQINHAVFLRQTSRGLSLTLL